MKRKAVFLLCAIMLTVSPVYAEEATTEAIEETIISAATTDELEDIIEQDVEDTIGGLTSEYETIKETLADFDAYLANPTLTEDFYIKTVTEINALTIRLREYTLKYAELIMASDDDYDDKYDDLEDIYDEIYEDAAEEIYDEIYDGMLDDMYDDIYDGIIDNAYENVEYSVWDDARSAEYSMWDDARSDIYSSYDDVRSDIYGFYDKTRTHVYKEDEVKVDKDIAKFQKLINKLKGIKDESAPTIDLTNLDLASVATTEEMDAIFEADVEATTNALWEEYAALQTEIDSYEKFKADPEKTEDFYDHVVEEVEHASGRLREYALRYAEIIYGSGMELRDQYDEFSDIRDAVYSDAAGSLSRELYRGLLKNAYKVFYNSILKSGFDVDSYSDVSGLRSDEYKHISNARSDVYSEISDLRSDVYSFVSDVRSAAWSQEAEKVEKEIEGFRKDTEKFNR